MCNGWDVVQGWESYVSNLCFGESYTLSLVSQKALREFIAPRALPINIVFEDENSNGSDENPVKRKIALKTTGPI